MNQEKIGKYIKDLRLKNKLTQKDFAETLGVTYQAVSKWENGKNIPDILILKEISKLYGVDINEILNADTSTSSKKNFKKVYILIPLFLILLILGIFIFKKGNGDLQFKHVTSACDEFKITGVAAYDSRKSSLYISNIEYCGDANKEVYDKISCTLYESYHDTVIRVSSCKEESNITLEEYLKNVEIKVDNYATICRDFSSIEMYLEINASNGGMMDFNHKIPLNIESNCN